MGVILLIFLIIATNLQAFKTSLLPLRKIIHHRSHSQKLFLKAKDLEQIRQLLLPLQRDVSDVSTKQGSMERKLNEMGLELSDLAGVFTESLIRQEEGKKKMEQIKPALFRSLPDLASFIISHVDEQSDSFQPKIFTKALKQNSNHSRLHHTNKATKKLISQIYHCNQTVVHSLVNQFNTRREFAEAIFSQPSKVDGLPSDKRTPFEDMIARFANSNKADRDMIMNSDSGFGLLLFSCCSNCTPTHKLEFDMQPQIRQIRVKKEFMVTVYEIKRSRALASNAVAQIRQRLKILENALVAIHNAERVDLEGVLLLPARNRDEFATTLPDADFDFRIEYR